MKYSKNKKDLFTQSPRIDEIIKQVVNILDTNLGGNNNYKLYLFGSRAKDQATTNADIDLAISCTDINDNQLRKIKREIANLRTLYSVDLVHLQAVAPDFRTIILSKVREINAG